MKFLFAIFAIVLTLSVTQAQVLDNTAVNLNFSGRLNEAKGVAINSAATVDLNSVAGNLVHVVGTTTVTSFGTASQAGIKRTVIFDGVLALTYNAASLVIPGNTTLTTAAGDVAEVIADTTTKWKVINYQRQVTAP